MLNTTNYNLSKPELTDTVGTSVPAISGNMDIIDTNLFAMVNTALLSANGWFKDKKTGYIYQWGTSPSVSFTTASPYYGGNVTATFPLAFPTACLFVACVGSGSSDAWGTASDTFTTTTAKLYARSFSGVNTSIRYIAIGN